jgi:hypothetical protein
VAVRQQVKLPEPEKPTVSLLGTIIGSNADDRIGVFLDTSTQSVVRLRVGEDHHGWVLRLIKMREATLGEGRRTGRGARIAGDAAMAGIGGPIPGMTGIVPPPGGLPGLQAESRTEPRRSLPPLQRR